MGAFPYWPPMHLRGQPATLTDLLHAALGGVVSVMMFTAVGFATTALGKRFRNYSLARGVLANSVGSVSRFAS